MTKQKQIETALWAIRSLAHQVGLLVEGVMLDLGLMKDEQRIFFSQKERRNIDMGP